MKPTLRQRFGYEFDNLMSRGTRVMIVILFVMSLVLVFAAGIFISLAGITQDNGKPLTIGEAIWESVVRTLDPGTMGQDSGPAFRGVMLVVTLGGIFVVSTLIGLLSNGIETQMDRLRKGRSLVLEEGHTLILGWSPQIFTILQELTVANENQKKARLVILADRDKVVMEDEIHERVRGNKKSRIICRSGSPIDPSALEIASVHTAKSIIVLPPENSTTDADVIKTILAIINNPRRRTDSYHIVTQIRNEKNLNILKLVGRNDNVQAVLIGDLISRIVAQTSRQSGLSTVYTELLDFEGDEIYFKLEAALFGKAYGEALLAYEDSCVMGIRKACGKILLNPPMDLRIESGDEIFALTEDDDTILFTGLESLPIHEAAIRACGTPLELTPEKCLILGWNSNGVTIVRELDHYVAKGSQVTVVADLKNGEKQFRTRGELQNQQFKWMQGETTDRDLLNELQVHEYNHVIVLADGNLHPQKADAKTLVTLLHLRDMAEQCGTPFSIVSEMLDLRNRNLAEATRVDDFIVSDHLASLMMSQLSENFELYDIFSDIFDWKGSEIYLKPVEDYVAVGETVNFYTVVEAARRRGQTAIGYRMLLEASEPAKSHGVHMNPTKSEPITFSLGDRIIVLAQD